jgi:hypothetical protein
MNKHMASKNAPVSNRNNDKSKLFGLSVEELTLVTGGGGIIIQSPFEIVSRIVIAPTAPLPLPLDPVAPPKP